MRSFLTAILFFLFCVSQDIFSFPIKIPFQGRFIADRQFLNGSYNLTVALSPSNTLDNVYWSETHQNIVFNQGYFYITIGSQSTLDSVRISSLNTYVIVRIGEAMNVYPLQYVPYTSKTLTAEEMTVLDASKILPNTTFYVPTINAGLNVGSILMVTSNKIMILKPSSNFLNMAVDVQTSINARQFYLNGVPLTQNFLWRNVLPANNLPGKSGLYQNTYSVSIGSPSLMKNVLLDVSGVGSVKRGFINAHSFLINGSPLSQSQRWEIVSGVPTDIYTNSKVGLGIGSASPQEALDIDAAFRLSGMQSFSLRPNPGVFQYFSGRYMGYVGDEGWKSIPGISPDPSISLLAERGFSPENQVAIFESDSFFKSSNLFFSNTQKSLALLRNSNIQSYPSSLFIQPADSTTPLYSVYENTKPIFYLSTLGKVGIATQNVSSVAKVVVSGNVDSLDLYQNGVNLRFAISKGDLFLMVSSVLNPNKANIYYDRGQVSIGRVYPGDFLQVNSPYKIDDDRTPYIHPAIGFSITDGVSGPDTYTLGTPIFDSGKFRLEKSSRLGTSTPLMVVKENYLGINVEDPGANLHITGNYGFLITGTYSDTIPLPYTLLPPSSMFFFYPAQSAFRSGYVDAFSSFKGTEWREENIGKYSNALGYNSLAYGNHSMVFGGGFNQALGAYDTILGGYQNNTGIPSSRASGFFSLALGKNASVIREGSFVWNSSANLFSSSSSNQFLINASVQLNKARALASSLVISPSPISSQNFQSLLSNPADALASEQILSALIADRYLNTEGEFDQFMPFFSPSTLVVVQYLYFSITTENLYTLLASRYSSQLNPSDITLTPLNESSARSLWANQIQQSASDQILNLLIEDGIVYRDSQSRGVFRIGLSFPMNFDSRYQAYIDSTVLNNLLSSMYASSQLVLPDTFISNLLPSLVSDTQWQTFLIAANSQAQGILFRDLVSKGYIYQNGYSFRFRPYFDFSQINFNKQQISKESLMSLLRQKYQGRILTTRGVEVVPGGVLTESFVIQNPANVLIGFNYTDSVVPSLLVSGNVGIGTTSPTAQLTIVLNPLSTSIPFLVSSPNSSTPNFQVDASGNVGIGMLNPGFYVDSSSQTLLDNIKLKTGPVLAEEMMLPNGQRINPKPIVDPWLYKLTTPNIYITTNVGIGTPSPNTLLSLSYFGDQRDPIISFDLNNQLYYALGMQFPRYSFFLSPFSSFSQRPSLVVKNASVGIGTFNPIGSLMVSGDVVFKEKLLVSTPDTSIDLIQTNRFDSQRFYINKNQLTSSGTNWNSSTNPNTAFRLLQDGPIGIGVSDNLTQALQVAGSVSANDYVISRQLVLSGLASANQYLLSSGFGTYGTMYVRNKDLIFNLGDDFVLSNMFTRGYGFSGNILLEGEDKFKQMQGSSILWKENPQKSSGTDAAWIYANGVWGWNSGYDYTKPGEIIFDGNLNFQFETSPNSRKKVNSFLYTDDPNPSVQYRYSAAVSYPDDGYFFSDSFSYILVSHNMILDEVLDTINITATKITAKNLPDIYQNASYISSLTNFRGLFVDLSQVKYQTGGSAAVNGNVYPAIFNGDVGIGTTMNIVGSTGNLNVSGDLKANGLIISERLYAYQMNLGSDKFFVSSLGTVGILKPAPIAPILLDVKGSAQFSSINIRNVVSANVLTHDSGNFSVNQNGKLSLGQSLFPKDGVSIEMGREISFDLSEDFIFQKYILTNRMISLQRDIYGLQFSYSTLNLNDRFGFLNKSNLLNPIKVNFSKLYAQPGAILTGLYVEVPSRNGESFSAIFNGGPVGIGAVDNNYALTVLGTLRSTNMPNVALQQQETGIFDYLNVIDSTSITLNSSTKINRLYARELTFKSNIIQSVDLNFGLSTSGNFITDSMVATYNVTANSLASSVLIKGDKLYLKEYLSFTKPLPNSDLLDSVLYVTPVFFADFLRVRHDLRLNTLSSFFSIQPNLIRLGKGDSKTFFSIYQSPFPASYMASDIRTWNPIRIQNSNVGATSAAGLLFDFSSSDFYTGIVALSTSNASSQRGSSLAFLNKATPVLYIDSDKGYIGVSTTNPVVFFDVPVNAIVQGSLKPFSTISINTLSSFEEIVTMNVGLNVTFNVTTNFESLYTSRALMITKNVLAPLHRQDYGHLYVDPITSDLFYSYKSAFSTVSGNISRPYPNIQNSFFYLTGSGAQPLPLFFNSSGLYPGAYYYQLATSNLSVQYEHNPLQFISNQPAALVKLVFNQPLYQTASSQYVGLDLQVTGNPRKSQETYVGVSVNVQPLMVSKSINIGGVSSTLLASKYAAIFLGGNFLIDIQNDFSNLSTSNVYIRSSSSFMPFLVETSIRTQALSVSQNSNIAIGSLPDDKVKFLISKPLNQPAFSISSNAHAPMMINKGLAIATSNLSQYTLNVEGGGFVRGSLISPILTILSTVNIANVFNVTKEGAVGVGLSVPTALLETQTIMTQNTVIPPHISIAVTMPNNFNQNLTLSSIRFVTTANNFISGTAKGLVISIPIDSTVNATVIGLNIASPNRFSNPSSGVYSALLNGGFVGIGLTEPTVALDIKGDVSANSITSVASTGFLLNSLQNATMNYLQGDTAFNLVADGLKVSTVNILSRLDAKAIQNNVGDFISKVEDNLSKGLTLNAANTMLDRLKLKNITSPSTAPSLPFSVYVSNTELYYRNDSTQYSLSTISNTLANANRIPFYNSQKSLFSSADLQLQSNLTATNLLLSNTNPQFSLFSTLDPGQMGTQTSFVAEKFSVLLDKRDTPSSLVFSGVSINAIQNAALSARDSIYGVYVDLGTSILKNSINPFTGVIDPVNRYAAILQGGPVVIMPTLENHPTASLYIKSKTGSDTFSKRFVDRAFVVSGNVNNVGMDVSSNASVAFHANSSISTVNLFIQTDDATDYAAFYSTDLTSVVRLGSKVGINTLVPSASFHVRLSPSDRVNITNTLNETAVLIKPGFVGFGGENTDLSGLALYYSNSATSNFFVSSSGGTQSYFNVSKNVSIAFNKKVDSGITDPQVKLRVGDQGLGSFVDQQHIRLINQSNFASLSFLSSATNLNHSLFISPVGVYGMDLFKQSNVSGKDYYHLPIYKQYFSDSTSVVSYTLSFEDKKLGAATLSKASTSPSILGTSTTSSSSGPFYLKVFNNADSNILSSWSASSTAVTNNAWQAFQANTFLKGATFEFSTSTSTTLPTYPVFRLYKGVGTDGELLREYDFNVLFQNKDMPYMQIRYGNVGLFTTNPSASLHVSYPKTSTKEDLPLFLVSTTNANFYPPFIMSKEGFVGIGTSNYQNKLVTFTDTDGTQTTRNVSSTLFVNGGIQFDNFELNPNGTLLQVPSAVVSTHIQSTDTQPTFAFLVSDNIKSEGAVLSRVSLTLNTNASNKTLIGLAVTLNTVTGVTASGSSTHYGLRVDVSNLDISDPNLDSTKPDSPLFNGKKYAAVFLTSPNKLDYKPEYLGIGISTPNSLLTVYTINEIGNVINAAPAEALRLSKTIGSTVTNFMVKIHQTYPFTFSSLTTKIPTSSIIDYVVSGYTSATGLPVLDSSSLLGIRFGGNTLTEDTSLTLLRKLAEQSILDIADGTTSATEARYFTFSSSFTTNFGTSGPTAITNAGLPFSFSPDYLKSFLLQYQNQNIVELKLTKFISGNEDSTTASPKITSLFLASGFRPLLDANIKELNPTSAVSIGSVMIGYTFVDNAAKKENFLYEPLLVSGNVRLGLWMPTGNVDSESSVFDRRLFFSGGPVVGKQKTDNSDNKDTFSLGRTNIMYTENLQPKTVSVLRLLMQDENAEGVSGLDIAFFVGSNDYTASNIQANTLTLQSTTSDQKKQMFDFASKPTPFSTFFSVVARTLLTDDGNPQNGGKNVPLVGIGTSEPQVLLHIQATGNLTTDPYLFNIQNTSPVTPNGNHSLGIYLTYTPGVVMGETTYLLSFLKKVEGSTREMHAMLGTITVVNLVSNAGAYSTSTAFDPTQAGISFSSLGSDYAEYIQKSDPFLSVLPAEVVGIVDGKVTKQTSRAQQAMVISSYPIVVGNWKEGCEKDHALVALLGQVMVNVRGSVKAGDYLIPSGFNDGYAVAISPRERFLANPDHIIGKALHSSEGSSSQVKVLIGFPFALEVYESSINQALVEITNIRDENKRLEKMIHDRLQNRHKRIQYLKDILRKQS